MRLLIVFFLLSCAEKPAPYYTDVLSFSTAAAPAEDTDTSSSLDADTDTDEDLPTELEDTDTSSAPATDTSSSSGSSPELDTDIDTATDTDSCQTQLEDLSCTPCFDCNKCRHGDGDPESWGCFGSIVHSVGCNDYDRYKPDDATSDCEYFICCEEL